MNKFKALEQFQSWPPEWQRLCAEYCIETGEDKPETPCNVEARFRNGDPVSIPFERPKAAKVAKRPARDGMRYSRNELIEIDSHVSEGRGPTEVARIMGKKYPGQRTIGAWAMTVDRMKTFGLQAMLDKSIDVEFK